MKKINEELHDLYSSPNIIMVIKWAGHITHKGEMRNENKTLAGKPEGKTLLCRPRHRWEDDIKMVSTECPQVWSRMTFPGLCQP
jgi:hypothetical protein